MKWLSELFVGCSGLSETTCFSYLVFETWFIYIKLKIWREGGVARPLTATFALKLTAWNSAWYDDHLPPVAEMTLYCMRWYHADVGTVDNIAIRSQVTEISRLEVISVLSPTLTSPSNFTWGLVSKYIVTNCSLTSVNWVASIIVHQPYDVISGMMMSR